MYICTFASGGWFAPPIVFMYLLWAMILSDKNFAYLV